MVNLSKGGPKMARTKATFSQMVNKLKKDKPLKQVTPTVRLPDVFDMFWDAKTGEDLERLIRCQPDLKKKVAQELSKAGFDAQAWIDQLT